MEKLNNGKKVLFGFLAILLLCSMIIVPSKAVGAATHYITINNAGKNQTYTAYQVFYKDGNDYAINSSSPFKTVIDDYNQSHTSDNKQISLREKEGSSGVLIATVTNSFLEDEAKELAAKFQNLASWPTSSDYLKATATTTTNTCTLGPVDNGYYAITSTFGPKIALTTILDADVSIYEKNTESDIGELFFDINRDAYGYGDRGDIYTKFRFTNESDYSFDTKGDFIIGNTYWYKAVNGREIAIFREFKEKIKVYYALDTAGTYVPSDTETALTENTDYILESLDPNYANWRITFTNTKKPTNFGKQNYSIYVKVEATVWDDLNVVDNDGVSAAYEFANPGSGVDHRALAKMQTNKSGTAEDHIVKDDSFRCLGTSLVKTITGDETGVVLDGAKFKLHFKNDINSDVLRFSTITTADGKRVLKTTNDGSGTEIIEAGALDIVGLGDGNYYLEETEAPEGYNKLTSLVKVTPKEFVTVGTDSVLASSFNKSISYNATAGKYSYDPSTKGLTKYGTVIENSQGIIIPGTGGIGTIIFIVVGFVLICCGVVYCVIRRRSNYNTVVK